LHHHGLWAMEVLDWEKMMQHQAYKSLQMEQTIPIKKTGIVTTRCPIRINGQKIFSHKAAPDLGEHNKKVFNDFIK